jgi:hypothetical protein
MKKFNQIILVFIVTGLADELGGSISLLYGGFDRLSHRHASLQLDKSSYQRN